jgi:hypothetical protein
MAKIWTSCSNPSSWEMFIQSLINYLCREKWGLQLDEGLLCHLQFVVICSKVSTCIKIVNESKWTISRTANWKTGFETLATLICRLHLWGYAKQVVLKVKINSMVHVKQRIRSTVESVTQDVDSWVWKELEYQIYMGKLTNGFTVSFTTIQVKL